MQNQIQNNNHIQSPYQLFTTNSLSQKQDIQISRLLFQITQIFKFPACNNQNQISTGQTKIINTQKKKIQHTQKENQAQQHEKIWA